ncbi:MAG TPA: aminotransferase class V-fold PLP-dependent enzyme, partial [Terriglobales bacterium]|nr:aminotransferase class V-fold PLP-dependent enzyme [Terriglobales bacterium]
VATAAGTVAFNSSALAELAEQAPSLPDKSLYDRNQDAYWAAVRKQFVIPKDEIYLNNGTCGSTPLPVLKAVFDSYNECEALDDPNPEQYPLFGYGAFDQYRQPLADFVGVSKDEIAIVRNATEANAIMANGLDLKPGDEVLMSDQEHPSGEGPWMMRAKRYGIVVKKFAIPKPPKAPADILNAVSDAITPQTKVIFVSQITTVTGVMLPVKEISALARSKNIVSMVDGAQVPGMMPLNIREIGCDMYGASPHKWLMSPKGSGFLWIRDEMIDRMWSNTTTAGWDDPKQRAARFQQFGSANLPIVAGMVASIKFAQEIGLDRIEKKHRELADYAHAELTKRGAESWTSPDSTMRCAIATLNLPPVQVPEMETWMWKNHRIRIRGGAPSKIRMAAGYYVQKNEMDKFLSAYDEYRKSVVRS